MTKADKYTLVRILFAPVFTLLYILPDYLPGLNYITGMVLLPLLCFAEFTDFLDGYYARKMKAVSDFGKLFDPFADVFLHLTAFFCYAKDGYVSFIILILLFYREFGMIFLRMVALKKGVAIGARKGGKLKTVFYISTSIVCLVFESALRLNMNLYDMEKYLRLIIDIMSVICVLLSYISFIDYIKNFKTLFFNKSVDEK